MSRQHDHGTETGEEKGKWKKLTSKKRTEFPDEEGGGAGELPQTHLHVEQGDASQRQEEEKRDQKRTCKSSSKVSAASR